MPGVAGHAEEARHARLQRWEQPVVAESRPASLGPLWTSSQGTFHVNRQDQEAFNQAGDQRTPPPRARPPSSRRFGRE